MMIQYRSSCGFYWTRSIAHKSNVNNNKTEGNTSGMRSYTTQFFVSSRMISFNAFKGMNFELHYIPNLGIFT